MGDTEKFEDFYSNAERRIRDLEKKTIRRRDHRIKTRRFFTERFAQTAAHHIHHGNLNANTVVGTLFWKLPCRKLN